MRLGSLFSGCGGFDLAAERVGMEVAWQSEIEPNACRVLEHHWPGVRNYGDITGMRAERLPAVDVVTGGFPCQDLSVAGKRAGLAGARSGLWWEFARLLRELRPAWVVIENVPGLLSSNSGNDMGTVLWTLGDMGYWWAYRVLDAQWFGVAQRRRRVFIVGHLGDRRAPATVLFEPESMPRHSPPRREAGQKPAGTLEARVRGGGYGYDTDTLNYVPILEAGARQGTKADERDGLGIGQPGDPMFSLQASKQHGIAVSLRGRDGGATAELGGDVMPSIRSSQGGGDKPHVLAHAATTHMAKGGDPTTDNYVVSHALTAEGHDASEDGTGRGTPLVAMREYQGDRIVEDSGTWPTLPAQGANNGGGAGARLHRPTDMMVRRLTPLECQRLQGFPDDFLDLDPPLSDSAKYRLMGNAIAVPVVEWILQRIADYERSLT